MINIVLVDDHDLVRTGIKRLLHDTPGIKVVGEARTGEDGLKVIRDLKPNIILMDVKMPGIGGLETIHKVLRSDPDAKIIVVSVFDNDFFPARLIQAGALGYISKGSSQDEMIQAIRSVQAGQRYISPEIANQIALRRLSDQKNSPFDELSERELQVMMLIIKGTKVQVVAEKLHLSSKTVNSYRYRIFDKLGIKTDVELIHLAFRYGLIDTTDVNL